MLTPRPMATHTDDRRARAERIGLLILETLETLLSHDAARGVLAMGVGRGGIPHEPIAAQQWLNTNLGPALENRVGVDSAISIVETLECLLFKVAGSTPTAKPSDLADDVDGESTDEFTWTPAARSEIRALRRRTEAIRTGPRTTLVLTPDPRLVGDLERRLGPDAKLRYVRTSADCFYRLAHINEPVLVVIDAPLGGYEELLWAHFPPSTHVVVRGGSRLLRRHLQISEVASTVCPPTTGPEDLAAACRSAIHQATPYRVGRRSDQAG